MTIQRRYLETMISLPPVLENLSVESFWHYFHWQTDRKEAAYLTEPFESALKRSTGFTDQNPPAEPLDKVVRCGSVSLCVYTVPATKRPSYADIYGDFEGFVRSLQEMKEQDMLKRHYRTVQTPEGTFLYIALDVLSGRINEDLNKMLSGKEGVTQTVNVLGPEDLIKHVPGKIVIVSGIDYSALAESNARAYAGAVSFVEAGDLNTGFRAEKECKRFKKLLFEDSLATLGEKPEPGAPVKMPYPFEGAVFVHAIKARDQVSYRPVISSMTKPLPKKIIKGSTAGDLAIAASLREEGLAEMLKEKGIWDEKFQQAYDPRLIDGAVYVRPDGALKRLEKFKKDATERVFDQYLYLRRAG